MKKIQSLLTKGLTQGYAGAEVKNVSRSGFDGKESHIEFPEGVYHDEWFVPNHLGGGQELVKVGDEQFTRLYAGGTPDPKILEEMGITTKDVSRYLKRKITELGEKTRLFEDCNPEVDEDWQYNYKISSNHPEFNVTTSLESISHRGNLVHIHTFILCPLE